MPIFVLFKKTNVSHVSGHKHPPPQARWFIIVFSSSWFHNAALSDCVALSSLQHIHGYQLEIRVLTYYSNSDFLYTNYNYTGRHSDSIKYTLSRILVITSVLFMGTFT